MLPKICKYCEDYSGDMCDNTKACNAMSHGTSYDMFTIDEMFGCRYWTLTGKRIDEETGRVIRIEKWHKQVT